MTDNVRTVIDEAERWLGFRPAGNMSTPFGELAGYNGQTWAGMFIDYIFFKAGVVIPSCGYGSIKIRGLGTSCSFHLR